eukprot:4371608-Alexandrium_andersonii.AAC.1
MNESSPAGRLRCAAPRRPKAVLRRAPPLPTRVRAAPRRSPPTRSRPRSGVRARAGGRACDAQLTGH